MTLARIASASIALVASLIGLPLLWTGGSRALQSLQTFTTTPDPLAVVLVLLGLVFVSVSAATVVLSSLGPIVVGAVHVVGSALVLLTFSNPLVSSGPALYRAFYLLPDRATADGAIIFLAGGVGLAIGAALIGGGVAGRLRRAPASPVRRIVAWLGGGALILLGVGVTLGAGSSVYRTMFAMLSFDLLGITVLLLGALLLAVGVATVGISGVGAVVAGAVTALVALVVVAVPTVAVAVDPSLRGVLYPIGSTGFVIAAGLVIAVVGAGVGIRARRVAARSAAAAGAGAGLLPPPTTAPLAPPASGPVA